jgi:hypothetical protein
MATRFSSLSEHMAYALKGVGEEEKKTEKRKEKHIKDATSGAKEKDLTPPASAGATPETRPRLSSLSRDASIFRTDRDVPPICPTLPLSSVTLTVRVRLPSQVLALAWRRKKVRHS